MKRAQGARCDTEEQPNLHGCASQTWRDDSASFCSVAVNGVHLWILPSRWCAATSGECVLVILTLNMLMIGMLGTWAASACCGLEVVQGEIEYGWPPHRPLGQFPDIASGFLPEIQFAWKTGQFQCISGLNQTHQAPWDCWKNEQHASVRHCYGDGVYVGECSLLCLKLRPPTGLFGRRSLRFGWEACCQKVGLSQPSLMRYQDWKMGWLVSNAILDLQNR